MSKVSIVKRESEVTIVLTETEACALQGILRRVGGRSEVRDITDKISMNIGRVLGYDNDLAVRQGMIVREDAQPQRRELWG